MSTSSTPRAAEALPVGTKLSGDQFTITKQLGAGGFGITYKAEDNILGRTIVIKECFSEDYCFREGSNVVARSADYDRQFKEIVRMFMREARSLAKLKHPNIVTVHRAFEENETAYMVLDLIDGFDLFEILGIGAAALPPDGVVEILMQLLDALEKVHEMDLLHRDISPDNIILENTGTPVLIDFGAARADASRRTRAVSSLLVVKDGYSPNEFYVPGSEQAFCSDLYALAATFYHAVSGEAPINSQARLIEVAASRPDPCKPLAGRFDNYEPAFLKAIDKAMRVHPAERLQSVAEWREMLHGGGVGLEYTGNEAPYEAPKIEVSLTELVQSTNDEVRKSRLIEVLPEPKPESKVKKDVPEWVEEFNRDGLRPRSSEVKTRIIDDYSAFDDADDFDDIDDFDDDDAENVVPMPSGRPRTRAVYSAPEPIRQETNWVDRALEKQERIRRTRIEEYEAAQAAAPKSRLVGLSKPISDKVVPEAPRQTEDVTPPEPSVLLSMVKMLVAGLVVGFVVILGATLLIPGLMPGL